jgi:hypothetical protein
MESNLAASSDYLRFRPAEEQVTKQKPFGDNRNQSPEDNEAAIILEKKNKRETRNIGAKSSKNNLN